MKDEAALDAALATIERDEEGGVDEKALIDEVANLIDFDADAEKYNKAKRIVARRRKPGSSDPEGQLSLPGLDPYAYEPKRLISDNDGHLVEQAMARPHYKLAEADRAQENARRVRTWADRKQREYNEYSAWAMKQLARRRKAADITFDVFVRESGVWSVESAEPEASDMDDAA